MSEPVSARTPGLSWRGPFAGAARPPAPRGWALWAWATLAAAVVGWFAAPLPGEAPALVKPRRDVWVIAPLPRVMDQTTLAAQVMGAAYWGAASQAAATAASAAAATDPRWRLSGIFGVGRQRSVLIEFLAEGKQPVRLKVGDVLPSGHRITVIDERGICIEIDRRSYRLGVERSAS